MARRPVIGGMVGLALACSGAGSAVAANGPDKAFVDKADGICVRANIKVVKLSPPKGYNPNAKLTVKILPVLAPFLQKELAIDMAQVRQWSAIGTPTTPAIRVAWTRWLALWKTIELPALTGAGADAKRGDLKSFMSSYTGVEAHTAEAKKLIKTIGFHDCDWSQ